MKLLLATFLLFVAQIARCSAYFPDVSGTECEDVFPAYNTTILISADPLEPEYYIANLVKNTTAPEGTTVCLLKYGGFLLGQPVVVVAANEGPLNAALCLTELLQCSPFVKEVIWTGTAGTSVQVGGVVNPGNCTASNSPVVRLGDVCVTPFSVQWDCFQATWAQTCDGYPNVCSEPAWQSSPTDYYEEYADCVYDRYLTGSIELADEILAATPTLEAANALADLPIRGPVTTAYLDQFFGNLSEGTGLEYQVEDNSALPFTIYDYTQCMEATSLFYWYGAPYDRLARVFEAQAISQALNMTVTADQVVGVSAEEATGISAAMYAYSKYRGATEIPFTIIRGLSDYNHAPLYEESPGVWQESTTFSFDDNNDLTYAYTRQAYSTVVFNLLKTRCMASGGSAQTCSLPVGINLGQTSNS